MKTQRRTPVQKAARTAKWATIMAMWGITHATGRSRSGAKKPVRWQLVKFEGSGGGESRGIVDAIAIRKDHRPGKDGLERGDRFEIVLIQVKGGEAKDPSHNDNRRMRQVAKELGAEAVLVRWKLGEEFTYSRLSASRNGKEFTWNKVGKPSELFGSRRHR